MSTTMREKVLQHQGELIVSALTSEGYQIRALNGCDLIAWEITTQDSEQWLLLTYLPRPIEQWRILPPQRNELQAKLYSVILSALERDR